MFAAYLCVFGLSLCLRYTSVLVAYLIVFRMPLCLWHFFVFVAQLCARGFCLRYTSVFVALYLFVCGIPQCLQDASAFVAFLKKNTQRRHTATHCNTLQHYATRCNTLQHTLQQPALHYNALTHTHTHTQARTCEQRIRYQCSYHKMPKSYHPISNPVP